MQARTVWPLNGPVTPAGADQADRLFATMTLAFAADPPCRWLFSNPETFLRHFPAFALALGGTALHTRTAFVCEGGAALWLPPGAEADEDALAALVERTVAVTRRPEVFALFDRMAATHPAGPHWYLPMIGVEPCAQGAGIGTALMQPVLERCDAAGMPAYLEATTLRSQRFYKRFGFETMGTILVADCPPLFPMQRASRR